MSNVFERNRMEVLSDGSVNIGITIVDKDFADPATSAPPGHTGWCICKETHVHGWETCDVAALFNKRERRQVVDDKGKPVVDGDKNPVMEDVPGTSEKERMVAWMSNHVSRLSSPKEIKIPTRTVKKMVKVEKVEKDEKGNPGKSVQVEEEVEVQEPIKEISLA